MANPIVKQQCHENCKRGDKECGGHRSTCFREAYFCPSCESLMFVFFVDIDDPCGLTTAIKGRVACPSCHVLVGLERSVVTPRGCYDLEHLQDERRLYYP